MINEELMKMDATAQAALVKNKRVSALELVDAAIARIEAVEPKIGALAATDFERARARARRPAPGPFSGVPFLIKDLLPYPGLRCSMGSRLLAENIPQNGSPYTEGLDACGLIVLGKSRTSEFGLLGSTETLLEGVTHNPWNLSHSAVGSSGGAAAAVASGMVPFAHGSDGGGSIRIPSSVCGLFGFKPSRGRYLSTGEAEAGDSFGLVSEHCLSRSVRDSARLLAALERSEDARYERLGFVAGPSERRLKIGVYRTTLMGDQPEGPVEQALNATAKLCESLGHQIIEAPPPDVDGPAISSAFFTSVGAALSGLMSAIPDPRAIEAVEPFTREMIEWFRTQPQDAVPRVGVAMEEAGQRMRAYLERYDVVLCPTLPRLPPKLGHLPGTLPRQETIARTERFAGYTPVHNIAGVPAMSLPLFHEALPIGSHFAARIGDEATLLGLAYELEAAAPWRDRWPQINAAAL